MLKRSIGLCAGLLLLTACGDETLVGAPATHAGAPDGVHQTGNPPDGKVTTPEPVPVIRKVLERLGPERLDLMQDEEREIPVRLLENDVAVPNAEIVFELEGMFGDARLSTEQTVTDAEGIARISLSSGMLPAQFRVIVTAADVAPLPIAVTVTVDDKGTLTVALDYRQAATQLLDSAEVFVLDSAQTCEQLLASARLPTALAARQLAKVTDLATFPNLQDGEVVTVVGRGKVGRQIAAIGCVEGVEIVARRSIRETVPLHLLAFDMTGTYELATIYDLHEALPGSLGDIVAAVYSIFGRDDDPARWLVERLGNLGPFTEAAVSVVDTLLHNLLPPQGWQVFHALGDIGRTVFNLEVHSTALVRPLGEGVYEVQEQWQELVYLWRNDCNPQLDPGCDRHVIPMTSTSMAPIEYTYPVTVDAAQRSLLTIDQHEIPVRYGQLFLIFFEQVLYPALVPGAHSTADILAEFVDCSQVALSIDKLDGTADGCLQLGGLCVMPNASSTAACGTALVSLGATIDDTVQRQGEDNPAMMTIGGTCMLRDSDNDLLVEAWTDGELAGTVELDGRLAPVTATLEAERL